MFSIKGAVSIGSVFVFFAISGLSQAISEAASEGGPTQYVYSYSSQLSWREPVARQPEEGPLRGTPLEGRGTPLEVAWQAEVKATPVWKKNTDQVVCFQTSNWQANQTLGQSNPSVDFDRIGTDLQSDFCLHVAYGKIQRIYLASTDKNENIVANNIKKGIASVFQFQTGPWEGTERDVSGDCSVQYGTDQHGVHKKKRDCSPDKSQQDGDRDRGDKKLLDLSVTSDYSALYRLLPSSMDVIESVEVREVVLSQVSLKRDVGGAATSRLKLMLTEQLDSPFSSIKAESADDAIKEVQKMLDVKLEPASIVGQKVQVQEKSNVKFKNALNSVKRQLKSSSVATEDATKAFLKLLSATKYVTTEELVTVLKDKKNKDVSLQLADILGTSGTSHAFDAVIESHWKDNEGLVERFLWALAQRVKPSKELVEKMFKLAQEKIPSAKLRETVILTLATLTRKLNDDDMTTKTIEWLISYMSSSPYCQKSQEEGCQLVALRAFQNLQSERSIPIVVQMIQSGQGKAPLAAVKVLSSGLPLFTLPKMAKITLLTVFFDLTADTAVRSAALDVLLKTKPSMQVLEQILATLDLSSQEFASLCTRKVQEFRLRDSYLDSLIRRHFQKDILNWNRLSQSGLSTSFTRQLAHTTSGNATFDFGMEMSGSVFKGSSFQVNLNDRKETAQLLKLDMFAGGLSSYLGGDDSNDDDSEEATAGMQLTILGNTLRPFVFFKTMSELLSLYWSGKAEEKTSALQGTQLLQDVEKTLRLSNGLIVDLEAKGVVSYDFSGKASISMWDKTSQSLVENSAAFLLRSRQHIQLPWHEMSSPATVGAGGGATIAHDVSARARLNLEMEMDVGGDEAKMCTRMHVPMFPVSITTRKTLSPSSKLEKVATLTKNSERNVAAKTLFLDAQNCRLCNRMYPK